MIYREKFYNCGQYAEVEIFLLPPKTKPLKRAKKEKESTPARKQLNDNAAVKKFIRLANTNFHSGDFSIELTFDKHHLPETVEELNKEVSNFIRRVKYALGKDAKKLKYLYVPSTKGKDGRRVRPHAHILIAGVTREHLKGKWDKGYINIDELQPDENGIEGKARYMVKQGGAGSKRWIGSRNLEAPQVTTSDTKVNSASAEKMYLRPDDRTMFEKRYRGWIFTECLPSIVTYDGSYYITIKLRKDFKKNKTRKITKDAACLSRPGKTSTTRRKKGAVT